MSLALGILVGRFTHFEYSGIAISAFIEGILTGLSLALNLTYMIRQRSKRQNTARIENVCLKSLILVSETTQNYLKSVLLQYIARATSQMSRTFSMNFTGVAFSRTEFSLLKRIFFLRLIFCVCFFVLFGESERERRREGKREQFVVCVGLKLQPPNPKKIFKASTTVTSGKTACLYTFEGF